MEPFARVRVEEPEDLGTWGRRTDNEKGQEHKKKRQKTELDERMLKSSS